MRAGDVLAAFEALPVGSLEDVVGHGTALILAPHPDDESLGCGGLIAACCAAGRPPVVVVVTDGVGSHPGSRAYPAERLRTLREAEAREAVTRLGVPLQRLHFLRCPDTRAPREGAGFDDAVARIRNIAAAAHCTTVLATWLHDPHGDHVAVQMMARAASSGMTLLSYPVWGWTLRPETELPVAEVGGWRLDVTAHLAAKRAAIAAHVSQTTDLIDDDPDGFRLDPAFLELFLRPFETFLQT